MSEHDNEKKLREALEHVIGNFDTAWGVGSLTPLGKALLSARQVLKDTTPEPPKHPAQLGWEKQSTAEGFNCRWCYMQAFKAALLWAAELDYLDLSDRQSDFLRDTANTVPL